MHLESKFTIRIEMLFIRVNAVEKCGPEKGRWVEFENEKLLNDYASEKTQCSRNWRPCSFFSVLVTKRNFHSKFSAQ